VGPQMSWSFPPLSLVHLLDNPLSHRMGVPHQHPDVPMTADRGADLRTDLPTMAEFLAAQGKYCPLSG
jgi:hypothetical protein